MAQHIKVRKENEWGETLENLEVNFADVINELYEIHGFEKKYPWIATVDPYGDTIFNRVQIPLVIEDLRRLQKDTRDKSLKEAIDRLIFFFENADVHQYIKLIGD